MASEDIYVEQYRGAADHSNANGLDRDRAVDDLDRALQVELKAHVAVVAIGEEWKKLLESGIDPTKEEHGLHAHLIRKWQVAAAVVAQILQTPRP